jgi:hypothetical protein
MTFNHDKFDVKFNPWNAWVISTHGSGCEAPSSFGGVASHTVGKERKRKELVLGLLMYFH